MTHEWYGQAVMCQLSWWSLCYLHTPTSIVKINNNNNNDWVGYMNQYIISNGRPYGFFYSIYFDFLPSKFLSLGHSYPFPLQSKASSVFLALFLSLLSSNILSSLPIRKYAVFAHAQTFLNDSLTSCSQYLLLLNPFLYIRFEFYPSNHVRSFIKTLFNISCFSC